MAPGANVHVFMHPLWFRHLKAALYNAKQYVTFETLSWIVLRVDILLAMFVLIYDTIDDW